MHYVCIVKSFNADHCIFIIIIRRRVVGNNGCISQLKLLKIVFYLSRVWNEICIYETLLVDNFHLLMLDVRKKPNAARFFGISGLDLKFTEPPL